MASRRSVSIARALLAALLAALAPSLLSAQSSYPARPLRMIVPFAPGGASDFVGRILQPRLGELLHQPVVIENRAGAAGNIGMEAAAKAAADGYTLYLGNIGTVAINPAVFAHLAVDPLRDFQPVTQVVDVPSVLVVHHALPVNTVKELVAYAQAHPGRLNYGTPGSGSQNRLEMELLRRLENLSMVHVPYKGGAGPAVAGLVGGETQLMFTTLPSALGQIRGGRIKALAVTSATRQESLPSVPTMLESGYAEVKSSSWQGMFLPAGAPQDIVDRLFAVLLQTMQTPDVTERLAQGGAEVATSASPHAFAAFVAAESRRWSKVAKEAGASMD